MVAVVVVFLGLGRELRLERAHLVGEFRQVEAHRVSSNRGVFPEHPFGAPISVGSRFVTLNLYKKLL